MLRRVPHMLCQTVWFLSQLENVTKVFDRSRTVSEIEFQIIDLRQQTMWSISCQPSSRCNYFTMGRWVKLMMTNSRLRVDTRLPDTTVQYHVDTCSTPVSTYYQLCSSVTSAANTPCLKKNDNDVTHNNFNAHYPILVIFCRDVAEWVRY